jgi:hypothetical protein
LGYAAIVGALAAAQGETEALQLTRCYRPHRRIERRRFCTLLVVSLEVPKTFNELPAIMRGFVSFAICFTLLMRVWYEQYVYFRRYNLQDTGSVVLNAILLFVVLFYVYPLKFLFSYLMNVWTGVSTLVHLPGGAVERMIEPEQLPALMASASARR